MDKLADTVLDYFWFLNFADEGEADFDLTLDLLNDVVYSICNEYSDAERAALMAAAQRRLDVYDQSVADPTQRTLVLSDEQRSFLKGLARGDFSGGDEEE